MIGFILIVAALIMGLAVLLGIELGTLTPHLIPLAIVFLALALLIGSAVPWRKSP